MAYRMRPGSALYKGAKVVMNRPLTDDELRAKAYIKIVRNAVATMYPLESAGIFGIMSTDEDGISEAYEEQRTELLDDIKYFGQTLNIVIE
jgi:hypothetical protein